VVLWDFKAMIYSSSHRGAHATVHFDICPLLPLGFEKSFDGKAFMERTLQGSRAEK